MHGHSNAAASRRSRLGGWLPEKEEHLARYRLNIAGAARASTAGALRNRSVQRLASLVRADPVLRMDLSRAIDEARQAGYTLGYGNIDELMIMLDYMLSYAPPYSETSLIHCPINAVLDWPMCMPSGYAVFRDASFNARLKDVLVDWCGYLSGPHSREHLTTEAPNGWFSQSADRHIHIDQFVHDKDKPHFGFASWNAFFTRHFVEGARPVASPDDPKVIVSMCEASPYNIQRNVRLYDRFWLKAQPYSLADVFGGDEPEIARRFEGGDVYQAFLSAFNYHRWHAPVSGTVTHAYRVDGTFYSDVEAEGEDPGGLNDSQGYIAAVASRALIVIEADDASIGAVGCVLVGMAEVSSCMMTVRPGQRVEKGDELGFFQYGGSTSCLIFRPGVIAEFGPHAPFSSDSPPVNVNAAIARAR